MRIKVTFTFCPILRAVEFIRLISNFGLKEATDFVAANIQPVRWAGRYDCVSGSFVCFIDPAKAFVELVNSHHYCDSIRVEEEPVSLVHDFTAHGKVDGGAKSHQCVMVEDNLGLGGW